MGNLFASLDAAAGALRAFRDGITVTQNNIQNASTPGYTKQTLSLEAEPFQLICGGDRRRPHGGHPRQPQ